MRQRSRIASVICRTVLLGALWTGLVQGAGEGLVLGVLAVPLAVALSLRLMPPGRPLRPGRMLALLPGFHLRSVLGGVDVAQRALAPAMPLAPGWISVPVALPPAGRVVLGAELSLMPGTLAAGSEGGRLLVHVLDRTADPARAIRAEEARIAAVLGPSADGDGPGSGGPGAGLGTGEPGPVGSGPVESGPVGSGPGGSGTVSGAPRSGAPGSGGAGTGGAGAEGSGAKGPGAKGSGAGTPGGPGPGEGAS